jgi:hypothetical protein
MLRLAGRLTDGEGTVMRRILVVDDDQHIRLAIGTWPKGYGFRVSLADGGVSGLAAERGMKSSNESASEVLAG